MSEQKSGKKRKWGDRRDARLVRTPGLQSIMGYLWPKRTDCEVYMHDTLDITELMEWLDKENASHPEYKTTVFHCAITALARMVRERPLMNRYIQGYRTYERDEISLSFIVKRRFADGAEESLMVLVPEDDDTLSSISRKIVGNVNETRKSEHSTGGIDSVIDAFAKIPMPILALAIRIIRYLDFWGINPKILTDGDTHYTTILASNLGSIGGPAVYHHLANYGTNSIIVTIGTYYKDEVRMPDGTKQLRTLIDIGVTLDERIADGFYFVRSLKLIKHIFRNPDLLEKPLGEHSGFVYE
ncbi:MAG: 2-oxo acid dehydrogenase subunit E2 [Lachnospiraceae bacterium]|nr:2-oxo acid dehydrogenase subunit E2 [Lachnospiraceae bacterium]MBR3735882.1 2-oxo acid dehydrogenase subunit E2 [Lachnospiraceae bacterium]